MPVRTAQALSDIAEFGQRLTRMRQLWKDLDSAVVAADEQRERLWQMRQDADDIYNGLTADTLAAVPFLLPSPRRLP